MLTKNFDNWIKGPMLVDVMTSFLGKGLPTEFFCPLYFLNIGYQNEGIFVVNGKGKRKIFPQFLNFHNLAINQDWYLQRKTASNLFKKKTLRGFVPVYHKHLDKMRKVLKEKEGEEIDVQRLFTSFTLETFFDVAFSFESIECISNFDQNKDLKDFQSAFDKLNEVMIHRIFNPLWK